MRCVMLGCTSNSMKCKTKSISFFRIPKKSAVREKWLKFCGNSILDVVHDRVCEKHFLPSDFSISQYGEFSKRKCLRPGTYPSVHNKKPNPKPKPGLKESLNNQIELNINFMDEHQDVTNVLSSGDEREEIQKNDFPLEAVLEPVTQFHNRKVYAGEDSSNNYINTENLIDESIPEPQPQIQLQPQIQVQPQPQTQLPPQQLQQDIDFRRVEVKQNSRLHVIETRLAEALRCIKSMKQTIEKRDEHSVFGELVAQRIRTCNKSHKEIAMAQHHIDNILFKLTMGSYAPSTAANETILGDEFQPDNLIVPKIEPDL